MKKPSQKSQTGLHHTSPATVLLPIFRGAALIHSASCPVPLKNHRHEAISKIPTGFHPSAQGCDAPPSCVATLGYRHQTFRNPESGCITTLNQCMARFRLASGISSST